MAEDWRYMINIAAGGANLSHEHWEALRGVVEYIKAADRKHEPWPGIARMAADLGMDVEKVELGIAALMFLGKLRPPPDVAAYISAKGLVKRRGEK